MYEQKKKKKVLKIKIKVEYFIAKNIYYNRE